MSPWQWSMIHGSKGVWKPPLYAASKATKERPASRHTKHCFAARRAAARGREGAAVAMFVVSGCSTKSVVCSRRIRTTRPSRCRGCALECGRAWRRLRACVSQYVQGGAADLQQFDIMHALVVDSVLITIAVDDVRACSDASPTDSAMQQCTDAPVAIYRSRSLSISVYRSRTAALLPHPQHVDVVRGLAARCCDYLAAC